MSDTTLFDIKEKLDILVKASFGVPSTSDKKEWSDEFVEKFNKGVKGSDILLEDIPENPDFTDITKIIEASDLGLQNSDFVGYSIDNSSIANCSIVDDSTGVVRRIQGLKLDRCDGIGTNNYSWTKKNASGKNVLFDSLQFNYKMNTDINGNVNKPYQYYLFTEQSGDSTIPEGNSGGNWVYDVNSGILLFPDVENLNNGEEKFKIGDNNKPVITVYVYIGKKGIANLEISDISGASTNTSNLSNRIDTNKSNIDTLESTVSDLSTNKIYTSTWKVTAVSGAYKFTGPGNLSDTSNPDIYLVRGQQYKFSVSVSGHPFRIQTQTGKSDTFTYGTGVIGNGKVTGDITFDVPMNAPSRLYYQCKEQEKMNGQIFIGDKKIYDLSQNLSTFETNTESNFTTVNEKVDNLDASLNNLNTNLRSHIDVSLNNLNTNLRSHIDNVVSGLDIKDSVKYASSENIDISVFDTTNGQIDGNTLSEGDRILLVGQTDKTQNGIYKKSASQLIRTDDFNSSENVSGGAFCFVEGGDTNSGKGFVLTNTGTISIGDTLLDFTQFSETGLADGAVTENKLGTDSVVTAKIKDGNVTTAKIADGNVTTAKIENGAVTAAKLEETYLKGITVKQVSNTADDQRHANISTISFDNDAGFNVTNTSTGEVKISLGSHWKTIQIDGTDKLTPSGEESLNLVDGSGINITANSNANPQSLTFSLNASITNLTDTPSTLGSAGQILKVNDDGNGLEFVDSSSGGSSTFIGLPDTPGGFTNQGGKFLKVNSAGDALIFTDAPSGGGGIKVVPSSASTASSIDYPTANTGSGTEGEIIYDASKNKFYGATNSKGDGQTGGAVAFRPLGYSFFAENMEGQPPAPAQDSFFFFLTSKTIVIKWTNPTQFHTGLTGSKEEAMPLNNTSPIVTAPDSTTGGQIWFPIVNRIMIQIKNLDDGSYQTWGTRTSPISNSIIENGRVICEKANIIPPASDDGVSNSSYYFAPQYNFGSDPGVQTRGNNDRVYKLKDFANSIILYKNKSIPDNLEGTDKSKSNLVEKRVYSAKQGDDTANEKYTLPDSENGFEISIWLENQYSKTGMDENDFNIVKLTKMNRIMDENEVEEISSSLIGQPIRFLTVAPPTRIRVADYGDTDGFHVKLNRINNTTIHYLECVIPIDAVNPTDTTKKNEDDIKVESTQSAGQENEVYFKGYFIEYQTIEADTNATKTLTQLATEFNNNGTSWTFVNFETFSSFKSGETINSESSTMATDAQADLGTVIYPSETTNSNNHGFISAASYSGGFSTKTRDIDWSVSKAFRLNQGDNKFYRFRIRGLNSGNKNVGPVSEKYFYFRFNEPDKITWNSPNPKFKANQLIKANQLSWDITLNWNSITNSSKVDVSGSYYTVSDLAIMEYKLQRRDSDSESWQTISYWENANDNPTTHNYQIWPTPPQTIDNNYESNSQTISWNTNTNLNKAEWVYYEATQGGTKVYTQEARLLAIDNSTPQTYKLRNPTYHFRIQARNYLFGKRVDAANSNAIETSIKQWFIEGTLDSTNNNKNITDSRWSTHSTSSVGLVTTAHTQLHTPQYTPLLQDNKDDKYEIKFYEQDNADTNSPWKNENGKTDYDDSNTRSVNYTNNADRSIQGQPGNAVPTNDYISYQWKITDETNKTTVDPTTGLSIDRYEIVETYSIGTSSNTTNVESTPTTIIYSPDFRRGPANWHIRVYNQYISSSPSFKYKVRAFNFFNSTSSKYSADSTQLTPIVPSSPRYLSSSAISGVNDKENSNPTFALTDDGITLLVDEPEFTGQTSVNSNQYQDQAISLSEFALQDIRLDSGGSAPTGEIALINTHGMTSRSGSSIQGNKSQVATFYHPNGYTSSSTTDNLKDLTTGKVDYTFHAKNVLKDEFSATSSCSLTIGKPNPGANFKLSPKFTWVANTNKVKLDFFRKYSTTDILYDDPNSDNTNGSKIAPLSAVTPNNCKFSNTVKKLAWEVRCAADNSNWKTFTNIPNAFATNTSFTTTGDNSNSTSAYTISDIDIEDQTKEVTYTIDYRIRNQYNQNYFASNVSNDIGSDIAPLQIKLTEPNLVTSISSKFRYALSTASASDSNNNNNLTINWTKPSQHGLHYKHQGGSLTTQTQPNIKSYIVYFYDNQTSNQTSKKYYTFTRTASPTNHPTVTDDVIIKSGWGSSNGLIVYSDSDYSNVVANDAIRLKPETTYTVEKITAINWLYSKESAAQATTTASTYYNGINSGTTNVNNGDKAAQYPPINGSTQITSGNAPKPTVFDNYKNQGILISAGTTTTVKILGDKDHGTPLTNVLLNAAYVKGTSSIMGIKIKVTDIGNSNTVTYSTECKFNDDAPVGGNNSLTLTYELNNLAQITLGTYSDLYSASQSFTDNKLYWFKNTSIKLKWLSGASNISSFYGKNLKFFTVVTYYAASGGTDIVVTREIENGYYDKTIGNPSDLSITPNYTPFTCLGLPILESTDTLTVTTEFDNKSSHWVASTAVNTITLGTNVASQTTSKSNHVYTSLPTVTLTNKDMGSYSGSSLKKDAQITVVAKNCNGTISATHSSKYIYDPKTLTVINTINSQNLTTEHIKVSSGGATGSATAGVVKMNVLKVPDNFNPTDKNEFTAEKLDVTSATVVGRNRLIIYDGKFCSAAYFKEQFGSSSDNYNSNVKTVLDDQTTNANNGGTFYGQGGSTTDTLKNYFRWQIFSMRYKNTSGGGVPIGNCVISLGSSTSTNITVNHLKKFSNGSSYTFQADSTSDVEIWIKYIRSAGDGLSKEESRWNKLIQNNINYVGAAHGAINQAWNGNDSSKSRTSSWVGGQLTGSNNNLKIQFHTGATAFTAHWDIFIAIGMRNNENVKTFIEIPKTIGKLTT